MKEVSHKKAYVRNPDTGEFEPLMAIRGENAYEIAVRLGKFTGTEEEWANYIEIERAAAVKSVEDKGAETLESIPDDYVALQEQVDNKIDKTSIAHELGDSEEKVLSQKAATEARNLEHFILEQGSITIPYGNLKDSEKFVRTKDYIFGNCALYVNSPYIIRLVVYYTKETLTYDSYEEINDTTANIGKDGCVAKVTITLDQATPISVEDVKNSTALEKLSAKLECLCDGSEMSIVNILLEQGGINALTGKLTDTETFLRTVNFIKRNVVLTVPKPYKIRSAVYYNTETFAYDSYEIIDKATANIGKDGCVAKVTITLDQATPISVEDVKKIADIEYLLTIQVSPLRGKNVFNFGDSIAEGGANNDKSYAHIIAENNEMTLRSFAVGGMTMANIKTNSVFVSVQNAINKYSSENVDFILLDGGCNDVNENVALGDIVSGYDVGNCDTSTFTGALESVFYNLRNAWAFANIIYVIVHKMTSRDAMLQKQFHDRIIEVCEKWCIPYVDLYNHGQITSHISSLATTCFNASNTSPTGYDRTHPNDVGYRKFYCPQIESKMKSLI